MLKEISGAVSSSAPKTPLSAQPSPVPASTSAENLAGAATLFDRIMGAGSRGGVAETADVSDKKKRGGGGKSAAKKKAGVKTAGGAFNAFFAGNLGASSAAKAEASPSPSTPAVCVCVCVRARARAARACVCVCVCVCGR